MKITEGIYRGVKSVTFDSGKMQMTFLPDNGGRLVSIKDKNGVEWMSFDGEGDKYKGLTLDSDYVSNDVFGMDDMFPTIDPENAPAGSGCRDGLLYNDHGEVARLSYESVKTIGDTLVMTLYSTRLFYRYTKQIYADNDGGIIVKWTVDNLSSDPFTFLWAGHCMLASEEGAKLVLPYKGKHTAEICFDELEQIGVRGTQFTVEEKHLIATKSHPVDGNTYKFYYLDKIPEGKIQLIRKAGTISLTYDCNKIPYLGVWMDNGRFKGFPCVAPEPCTVAFDKPSAAAERNQFSVIPSHGTFEFEIKFDIN